MITLGTASAPPGETDMWRLQVGECQDGSATELPVAVINGAEDGKTLYVQAASDGDELNGVGVVCRFVPRVDPTELAGTILIVGIVNYHAFQIAEHRNPIDGRKLNRTYPGDKAGSSSERLSWATFDVATRADLALDLHQGSTSRMLNETRVRCGSRHTLYDRCLELAKVFGCGYILDQIGPQGQLARAGPDKGVTTIDPELGGSVGLNEESVRLDVREIFNMLRAYGFLRGETESEPQIRASGFEQYSSPVGGIVDFAVDLGEQVAAGDTLFTVTDVFGDTKATVSADRDCVFWRSRRLPQVASGEYVCSVGTDIDRY